MFEHVGAVQRLTILIEMTLAGIQQTIDPGMEFFRTVVGVAQFRNAVQRRDLLYV